MSARQYTHPFKGIPSQVKGFIRGARPKLRLSVVLFLAFGMVATNMEIPPASALAGMTLDVDYTPDSSATATEVAPGSKVDLTATAPVAVAGTTQQEIVQDISPLLSLQSVSDIVAPAGWTISYSTDGTTWTTTAPTTAAGWSAIRKVKASGELISQGADNVGRQIASTDANAAQPTTGQFPTTTGATGDGWNVFFDDAGHIFNVWHHNGSGGSNVGSSNQSVDCHLRTGESCGPSWPFRIVSLSTAPIFNMHTSEQSGGWFDTVDNEIWFPTVYTSGGVNQVGFGCIKAGDVSLVNKWCGGTADTSFVSGGASSNVPSTGFSCGQSNQIYDCVGGLAQYGDRLFTWAVNTGDIVCIDIRLNSGAGGPCASGGLIDFGANLATARAGNYRWRPTVGEWGGRIYASAGNATKAVCIDAMTGSACTGWTNPRTITKAAVHFSKLPTAQGGVAGACFSALGSGANGGFFQCFDAAGTDVSSLATSNFTTKYIATYVATYDAYSQNWETYKSRMYWGDANWAVGQGKIYCWDFATDTWCKNWAATGIADSNYQLAIDPTNPYCIWSNSNDGIIQTYDAYTGAAGNCAVPPPTVVFEAGLLMPRMACSSADAIQGWRSFVLNTTTPFTTASLTIKTAAGAAIAGWSNISIPGNNTIDLSALTISESGQNPSFTVTFTGRTLNGEVGARITAVGGAPQLCLRPTAMLCPTGPIFTASQFNATTTTVTADGSASDGTTVTPLSQATASVNIGAGNPALCATSLSGTARDTAANPMPGATVALADSAGVPLTYPATYGVVALRGQPITTVTAADGTYSFPNLVAGSYTVIFKDVPTAAVTKTVVTTGNAGTLANRTTTETTTAITSLLSKVSTIAIGTPGVIDGEYTVMPTLTKKFVPATVAIGEIATLVFTFTNAPGNTAKTGLGFVDTLPSGMQVAADNNLMTTCPGGTQTSNPAAMSTTTNTVTVTGATMTAGVASCEYTVSVIATAAGTYTNGADNVVTTGFTKNTKDVLIATTPANAGAFTCNSYMYHYMNQQLYRQSPNESLAYEIGTKLTTAVIDGIGFNQADGYLYGIATTGGDGLTAGNLIRISSDGTPTDLGAISGVTVADMTAIRGGDVDATGNLIVKKTGSTTTLYSINLATRVATTITVSVAMNGDDIAYSAGKIYTASGMYFYMATQDASPDYSWVSTQRSIFPSNYAGSMSLFSNGFGDLIVVDGYRQYYRTSTPATASASSAFTYMYQVGALPIDGAMCHSTPKPTAFPDETVGPVNTAQSINVVTNDTNSKNAAGVAAAMNPASIKLCNPSTNQVAPNCTVGPGGSIVVPNEGTYTVSNTGVVTFTPLSTFTGPATPLGYQIADVNGNIGSSTYTPTVTTTSPVAINDTSTGPYDTNQTITPLTNDISGTLSPIDPSTVRICTTATVIASCTGTTLTVPNEGTYSVNASGTVTFDPLPTFRGTATPIQYVVQDGIQQVTSATITPTVTAPNAPVATAQTKTLIPGATTNFTTLTGASGLATATAGFNTASTCLITPGSSPATCDADGIVTIANEGTYTLNNGTGVVTFVAASNVTPGTKTALTYQVTDITGQTATSTLTPIISPLPTATNDTSSGAYDTNQTITPSTNDAAGAGATLDATSVKLCATTATANASCNLTTLTVANEGTYTVNANGTVTFDPLSTFTGTASPVKYVIADSTTQLASATITPTVAMPAAPVATAETKLVIPGGTATFTTISGTGALATSGVGLVAASTCLITPASSPATCDADGVVTIAGQGTYTLNTSTGVVTYVADPAATPGTKTAITYRVTDTFGQTATSTLTPTIPPLPVAVNDTSTGAWDTNQTINVLTNDSATNPATLDASSVKLCATTATANASCNLTTLTVANQGTYTVNANGTVTFDPLPSFSGTASPVKYAVTDSNGQLAGATITPTVSLPAIPIASPETKQVIPGGTVAFTTTTGAGGLATSGPGFNTTASCLYTPSTTTCDADGIVVIAGQGTFTLDKTTGIVTYVALSNATAGTKTAITYKVVDIFGQSATSTLTPIIPPAPTATANTSTGAWDTVQTISVLTNDTPGSGATLVASSVKLCATTATANASCNLTTLTVANEGTYTANPDGTVSFDPLPSFKGTATPVKYVVEDSTGQLAGANITATVTAPALPVATSETKSVIPGGTATFTTTTGTGGLATATAGFNTTATCLYTPGTSTCDADGIVVVAGQGTYTLNQSTGVVTYVADVAATAGTKTAITYKVVDATGQSATATLTPTIPPAPTATANTSTGAWDTVQTISVTTNDTPGSGATLVASSVKLCATTATANASCNLTTLTVANEGTYTANADGTVSFDPLPSFKGTATPVKYVVADSTGQLAGANITATVTAPALPVATSETKTVIPGGTATFTTTTGTGGLATATAGFNTTATCLYTPSTTTCDADGIVTITGQGTYTLNQSTGVVTYVADPAATVGTKTAITYKVVDATGQSATSTLTPVIPPAPVATNDTSSGAFDTNQTITILTNDTVTSPATLVASSVKLCATTATANASCNLTTLTVANQGTYTVNANGTVTFDPLPTFTGTASPVKYAVADSNGQLTGATITPTVAMPALPVATPEQRTMIAGGTTTFTTLTGTGALATSGVGLNASVTCLYMPSTTTCDSDGVVTIAGEGTYTLDVATGVVTYVADAAATSGTKTAITYKVTDTFGQTATSTLTPILSLAPVAANDTSTGAYDTNQVVSVLTNDNPGAGATLTVSTLKLCATTATANASCNLTTLTVPNEGTYTVNANGTITFDPLPTFKGTASPVKYVVADSTTQLTSAILTPTVTPPAAPVATPETKAVIPGATATFTVLTGTGGLATSGVGLVTSSTCLLTPSTTTCDADGVVTIAGEGTYTFNSSTGVVTFVADPAVTQGTKTPISYRVTDITGQTATSTLTPVIPAPPVATNDTSTGAYDTNQTISVLTNDSVTSPAALLASTVKLCATTATANTSCNLTTLTVANQGTYTVNANGTVTFDPLPTFTGTASPVKYAVQDSTGQYTGATITPTVSMPAAPVATPESKAVIPGGTATFTTLTGTNGLATSGVGFTNASTCLITPSTVTCDADGVVVVAGEGTYTLNTTTGVVTFVADLSATQGTKTPLSYRVTDVFGQTATSTLTPVIPAPPVGVNDTSTGAYDVNQTISVLTNDSVTSPAKLIVGTVKLCATTSTANASCNLTTLTIPGEGTYTVNPDGTVTFNPLPTFTGTASPVKYAVQDSTGQLTGATITPTVTPPAAPVATPESKAVIPGGTATFTTLTGNNGLATSGVGFTNASTCLMTPSTATCDADGVVVVAGEGTYTLNTTTGVVTFVADVNATSGTKTPISYRVTDITGQTATSTLTPVIPVPPVATDDTSTGAYDVNQIIPILTNDSVTSPATLVASTVKLCATTSTANASCNLTTLTIPSEGTYTVNPDGTVTFNPLSTFTGTASPVKYAVQDSTGQLTSATITPTVLMPVAPYATPQTKAVIPGGTATFTTLTGASGLATSSVAFNTTATCLFTPGTATCDADGSVTIAGEGTYTLNTATGIVTFVADVNATQGTKTAMTYQVTDVFGQTATATLTPIIPAPPVAVNDTSSAAFDTNQTISPLTNDIVTSPATLVASTVKLCATTSTANASCNLATLTVANQGTYTVNANGTVIFDPLPTFSGTASPVKYIVQDSTGQLTGATITPTVGLPPVPVATPQTKIVIPGGTVNFTTLTGASGLATSGVGFNTSSTCLLTPGTTTCDADGIVAIAGEGTFTLNTSTGVVAFVADVNATVGTKTSISYRVTDIFGQTATSTLTPVIPAPPAAVNDTSTGAYDVNQVISPLTNDSAVAPATLVPSSVKLCATTSTANASCNLTTLTVPNEGTYTVNANGTVTFDPLPTFVGTASPVKYIVADINGRVANATITPTVNMPPPPVATPDLRVVAPASTVTFQPVTGSGSLAVAAVGGAALNASSLCIVDPTTNICGTSPVTIDGEGTFTLDVTTGIISYSSFIDTPIGRRTSITYKITDIFGQTVTSTLTPVIPPMPTIANDTSSGPWNSAQTLVPVTNDIAGTGTILNATSVKLCDASVTTATACNLTTLTVAGEGTYIVLSNGNVKFTPLPSFFGTATTIKYSVSDGANQTAMATITVVVAPPTSKPIAKPQKLEVNRGETIQFTTITGKQGLAVSKIGLAKTNTCLIDPSPVVAADTLVCDPDGIVTVKNLGTFKLNKSTGIVTFTASRNAKAGKGLSITYQVTDFAGQTATSTLTPIIPAKPQLPATGANSTEPLLLAALMLIGIGMAVNRSKRLVSRHA